MTVGTGRGAHPAAELLNSAVELARKAAEMLSADQVWTAYNSDLITVLREAEKLSSATEVVRLCAVRETDVRGVAGEHGAPSTQSWLAQLLTLHPGEANARVKAADLLTRKSLSRFLCKRV